MLTLDKSKTGFETAWYRLTPPLFSLNAFSFIPSVTSFMYYITRMGKVTKKSQKIYRLNVAMPTKSNI